MTIPDEAVEAARQALHRVRWERMKRMIEGDRRAMGEREPGDPPDMQEDARAALEAAAPHLYPASGEVGEVVKNIDRLEALAWAALKAAPGEWECDCQDSEGAYGAGPDARHGFKVPVLYAGGKQVLTADGSEIALVREEYDEGGGSAWDDTSMDVVDYVVAANPVVILALLSALSEATERAGRMERERDEARQGERNLSEHARKVAGEANEAFGVVEHMDEFWDACGYPSNRGHLTPAEQVSALVRERDDAETRAQSAQAEATRLKEKLDEAGKLLSPLASAAGFIDSETTGFQDDDTLDLTLEDIVLERIKISHLRAALRWTEEASQGEGE